MTRITVYNIAEGPIQTISELVNYYLREGYKPFGQLQIYVSKTFREYNQRIEKCDNEICYYL